MLHNEYKYLIHKWDVVVKFLLFILDYIHSSETWIFVERYWNWYSADKQNLPHLEIRYLSFECYIRCSLDDLLIMKKADSFWKNFSSFYPIYIYVYFFYLQTVAFRKVFVLEQWNYFRNLSYFPSGGFTMESLVTICN